MKTIGLIGGMSWQSTQQYYQIMNQHMQALLGGDHSIEALIYSINFDRVLSLAHNNQWQSVGEIILQLAKKLEVAGADFLMIAANTTHKVFPQIAPAIKVPFLHIVDPTAEAIKKANITKVGLLGTRTTMQEDFYQQRLLHNYAIETLVPELDDQNALHQIIFEELTLGYVRPSATKKILMIIKKLTQQGAQGIILGCTEFTQLALQKGTDIPLFDTTRLHAKSAVELACSTC